MWVVGVGCVSVGCVGVCRVGVSCVDVGGWCGLCKCGGALTHSAVSARVGRPSARVTCYIRDMLH